MKVLIACEESQRICIAFRELGHIAFSCDLQDCSGGHPEWHIKGDCLAALEYNSWDLVIAHPPCTYLANSGACRMFVNGKVNEERYQKMLLARDFFMRFYNLEGVKLCIENPVPMSIAALPLYSQTVQPYEFGDPYTKLTCLWLKGLPYLFPECYAANKRVGANVSSWVMSSRDSKQRSKTFPGIASAMAAQWGNLL